MKTHPCFKPIKHLILLASVAVATLNTNAASVLDSFNNVSGPSVANGAALTLFSTTATAGGIGFTTGYDQANSQVDVIRTNDLSVSLVNYVSGQTNTANHWSVAATTASVGLARRAKYRDVTPLTGTIWFSFLASLQNANGDIALGFNGSLASGSYNTTLPGMRVGLGNPARPGAFGVGPVMANANLSTITDGVNGAITTNGFAPTNGIAGLVLGKISTDLATGFPKVELWYNPDVISEAALPAPVLKFIDTNSTFVTTTITRVGYQVVRATTAVQNEVIDNVKISDEPNGFDIVYKNVPLPLPLLNVAATSQGSETGPSNLVFTITSDRAVISPVTVTYRYGGIATNGFDGTTFIDADYTDTNFNTGTQAGSFTIPVGQSNAVITLAVIDDALPEGNESVMITLDSGSEYLLGISSATATITENNDANVSLQYMFTRTLAPQIWDTNITASAFSGAGVGGGYSGTAGYFISADASIRAQGDLTADNAVDAVANGDFMSFSVSPIPGRALNLTNIQFQALYGNFQSQEPGAAAAVVFLRSSLDNYTSDLGSWTLQPDTVISPAWYDINAVLGNAFTNLIGGVGFRLYIYDDSAQNQVGVRIDNLYLRGVTFSAVGAQQVSISTTITNAAEPGTAGTFTITRVGDTANSLTVNYSVEGTASNGVDYVFLPGSAIVPAGQSNVVVAVTPIDDDLIESSETVTLTLSVSPNYGILSSVTATVNLADDGDFGGLIGYLFNEGNNSATSLSEVAVASTKQPDKVSGLNAAAGFNMGNFGANLVAGVGHGYATSASHSAPSTLYIRGEYLAKSAADSLTQSNYFSFTIAPKPGYTLTLTNFTAYLKMISGAGETTWLFLRSSIDDFTTDLGDTSVSGTATGEPFQFWSGALSVANRAEPVEFRIYFYNNTSTIIRLDDVGFQGFATAATVRPAITGITVAGGNVTINFTGAAGDNAADFKLQSSATVDGNFADDNTAIVTGSAGSFQTTTTANGATRFYKIKR